MRAAKGESKARTWLAAAALLLVLLAGGRTPAAASLPSPIASLAASPAPIDELPQPAAAPPATSSLPTPAAFSLFARPPCRPAPASAPDDRLSYRKTRVWGLDLAARPCARGLRHLSHRSQEAYGVRIAAIPVDPP